MAKKSFIVQDVIWEEGRREGIVHAKSETLKRQIAETFGPLSKQLDAHIDEQPEEVLDEFLDCLLADTISVSAKEGFALMNRMFERLFELHLGQRYYLLLHDIQTLFDLTPEQEARFNVRKAPGDYRIVVREFAHTYKTMRDDGQEEGEVEGRREILKRQLTAKFGSLPEKTVAFLDTVQTKERLNRFLDRVLIAKSLDLVGLGRDALLTPRTRVVPYS